MKCLARCAMTVLLLFGPALHEAAAQKVVPELWGLRVHDEAGVLNQQTVQMLEHQLEIYEDSTSNQIAILIVASLENEQLEEYTLRVAETWELGQQGKDNGVLLFIAVNDRLIRIESGYGLEGVLTDVQCNRIIRNEIAPLLRKDDFDGAVTNAVMAIIQSIGGEYHAEDSDKIDWENVVQNVVYGFFLLLMVGFTGFALFSQGCLGWGFYVFLIPCYFTLPWDLIGKTATLILLSLFVVAVPIVRTVISHNPKLKKKFKGWTLNEGGSGGSSGGGRSSGSWSSSSSSSGSFSGGGGSFGGGGSSGSW
jgi:uncharacterized protein